MPFPNDDPLSSLGLEEGGDGSAWSGADEWPTASDERADRAESHIPSGEGGWESAENPYRAKYEELQKKYESTPSVATKLRDTVAALQQQAADAWDQNYRLWQQNQQSAYHPKQAEQLIQIKLDELMARAELEATREAALPHVRRGSADQIAAEFSDRKAGITV